MRFGQGDPKDIIEWFKESSCAHWLGFFLSGDENYNKLMNSVLEKADLFDTISGVNIDLFLFDTGQQVNLKMGGVDINVDATPLTKLEQRYVWDSSRADRLTISGLRDISLTATTRKAVAKMSGRATNDLVECLGLGVDDLPSLVLLRKDFSFVSKRPVLVLRTRGKADADFLIEFLRGLRRLSEAQSKAARRLELGWPGDADEMLNKEIKSVTAIRRQAIRQAAFLANTLRTLNIEMSETLVVDHLFSAISAREGIERALASIGVGQDKLNQLEECDPRIRNVSLELQKTRKRLDHVIRVTESYIECYQASLAEFESLIAQFERKISFRIAKDYAFDFFQVLTPTLRKAKHLIELLGAVKTGGSSLLS